MNVRSVVLNNQILEIISKEMTSNTEKLLSCQENNTKKIKSGNINTKHLKSLENFSCYTLASKVFYDLSVSV